MRRGMIGWMRMRERVVTCSHRLGVNYVVCMFWLERVQDRKVTHAGYMLLEEHEM